MERTFARGLDSLDAIFVFLSERIEALELDPGSGFAVNMAVEELFTNMVKYNRSGTGGISIAVSGQPDGVEIRMVDFDSEPFDITSMAEVDTTAPLEARRPGGLGIHLVRCLMDEVQYEYKSRRTTIRLFKNRP